MALELISKKREPRDLLQNTVFHSGNGRDTGNVFTNFLIKNGARRRKRRR
jgi:hypothetical protein